MENKNITIGKAHRTGSKLNGKTRAIRQKANIDKNNSGRTMFT